MSDKAKSDAVEGRDTHPWTKVTPKKESEKPGRDVLDYNCTTVDGGFPIFHQRYHLTRSQPFRAVYTAMTSSPFSNLTVTFAETYFPLLDGPREGWQP